MSTWFNHYLRQDTHFLTRHQSRTPQSQPAECHGVEYVSLFCEHRNTKDHKVTLKPPPVTVRYKDVITRPVVLGIPAQLLRSTTFFLSVLFFRDTIPASPTVRCTPHTQTNPFPPTECLSPSFTHLRLVFRRFSSTPFPPIDSTNRWNKRFLLQLYQQGSIFMESLVHEFLCGKWNMDCSWSGMSWEHLMRFVPQWHYSVFEHQDENWNLNCSITSMTNSFQFSPQDCITVQYGTLKTFRLFWNWKTLCVQGRFCLCLVHVVTPLSNALG